MTGDVSASDLLTTWSLLAPVGAAAFTVVTLVMTQARASRIENRSAAKETVVMLETQNTLLSKELHELHERMKPLEEALMRSETQRTVLAEHLASLTSLLVERTNSIRSDLAENTAISRAAFHEANEAKAAIAESVEVATAQAKASYARLSRLEDSAPS